MTRTSKILEDVTDHYHHLQNEHKKLHDLVENWGNGNLDVLKQLKQKKLKIKDEIEDLKVRLNSIFN